MHYEDGFSSLELFMQIGYINNVKRRSLIRKCNVLVNDSSE